MSDLSGAGKNANTARHVVTTKVVTTWLFSVTTRNELSRHYVDVFGG